MSKTKVVYKYCLVPDCPNTSKNAPEKWFINVPSDIKIRKVWQKAMRREVFVSNKSHVYCCEDHFKVEEDIENYMYIKTMNSGKVRLKPGVVPRFFDCQKNRVTTHSSKPRSQFLQTKAQQSVIKTLLLSSKNRTSEENQVEEENQMDIRRKEPISKEIGVQACIKAYVRSKAIQCGGEGFSIPKMAKKRKSSSNEGVSKKSRIEKVGKLINEDISISTSGSSFTFTSSELSISDPNDSFYPDTNRSEEIQQRTFYLIEKNPKLYLGVPSHSLFVVNLLTKKCELDKLDIFLTLKKIKLNLPYRILADDFGVPLSRVCSIIQKTIPLLAGYLYPFVQWMPLSEVKKRLPIPFRRRYKNVQCIIDCFEISHMVGI